MKEEPCDDRRAIVLDPSMVHEAGQALQPGALVRTALCLRFTGLARATRPIPPPLWAGWFRVYHGLRPEALSSIPNSALHHPFAPPAKAHPSNHSARPLPLIRGDPTMPIDAMLGKNLQ